MMGASVAYGFLTLYMTRENPPENVVILKMNTMLYVPCCMEALLNSLYTQYLKAYLLFLDIWNSTWMLFPDKITFFIP